MNLAELVVFGSEPEFFKDLARLTNVCNFDATHDQSSGLFAHLDTSENFQHKPTVTTKIMRNKPSGRTDKDSIKT